MGRRLLHLTLPDSVDYGPFGINSKWMYKRFANASSDSGLLAALEVCAKTANKVLNTAKMHRLLLFLYANQYDKLLKNDENNQAVKITEDEREAIIMTMMTVDVISFYMVFAEWVALYASYKKWSVTTLWTMLTSQVETDEALTNFINFWHSGQTDPVKMLAFCKEKNRKPYVLPTLAQYSEATLFLSTNKVMDEDAVKKIHTIMEVTDGTSKP